jgi:hypothetical protein
LAQLQLANTAIGEGLSEGGVDRYAEYLRRRWNEGCRNTHQLWRELREQGFEGKAGRQVSQAHWCRRETLDHSLSQSLTDRTH